MPCVQTHAHTQAHAARMKTRMRFSALQSHNNNQGYMQIHAHCLGFALYEPHKRVIMCSTHTMPPTGCVRVSQLLPLLDAPIGDSLPWWGRTGEGCAKSCWTQLDPCGRPYPRIMGGAGKRGDIRSVWTGEGKASNVRRASHFSIFYLTFASLSGQVTSYFCHWAGRQSATEERCDAAISHVVTWRRTCDVECLGRGPLWKSGNIDRCKSLCRVSNCVRVDYREISSREKNKDTQIWKKTWKRGQQLWMDEEHTVLWALQLTPGSDVQKRKYFSKNQRPI